MTTSSSLRFRRSAIAVSCAGVILAITGFAPALATSVHQRAGTKIGPVSPGSRYLALGDSVTFGYREDNAIPAPDDSNAKSIIGYPALVAKNLDLKVTNASCPGETTDSFIDVTKPSNGCEDAYRANFPLHASYASDTQSQLQFAEAFLKQYPNTRLVTLMIGANDGFRCIANTPDQCQSEFGMLTASITKNVTKILKGIRNKAHYSGQLAVLTYYSPDYNKTSGGVITFETGLLNSAVEAAAKDFNVETADGFGQFKEAAKQAHGHTCAAQLLTALSGADKGTCGVHPSLAGQALLAQAIEQAIVK